MHSTALQAKATQYPFLPSPSPVAPTRPKRIESYVKRTRGWWNPLLTRLMDYVLLATKHRFAQLEFDHHPFNSSAK